MGGLQNYYKLPILSILVGKQNCGEILKLHLLRIHFRNKKRKSKTQNMNKKKHFKSIPCSNEF